MNSPDLIKNIDALYKKYQYEPTDFSIGPSEIADLLGEDCIDGCDRHKILLRLEYLLKNHSKEKIEKYIQKEKEKK